MRSRRYLQQSRLLIICLSERAIDPARITYKSLPNSWGLEVMFILLVSRIQYIHTSQHWIYTFNHPCEKPSDWQWSKQWQWARRLLLRLQEEYLNR